MSSEKKIAYAGVEGNKSLIRDTYSKAILNTNDVARSEHRRRRKMLKERIDIMKELKTEQESKINNLERQVDELKTLIYQLVNKEN